MFSFVLMACKANAPTEEADTKVDNNQAQTEQNEADDTQTKDNTESDVPANDVITDTANDETEKEAELPLLPTYTAMRDITTMELVREMGLGINLGNTFEACGDWINKSSIDNYIKAWGSPIITEKMIKGYADSGFGVLRIPVAWSNLMSDDGSYTINPDLMRKVQEVVNWTNDNGMYAIVNIHWDNGWFSEFSTKKDESMEKYTRIWTQISESFKDYGDLLMFESLNEELGWQDIWNRWSGNSDGKAEAYALGNEINQTFVDIVRSSGGNNSNRHLLIAGYNTDIELTCDPLFLMPNDPADRCALSIHYYTPSTLTIIEEDATWGKARTTWGTEADLKELDKYVQMMKINYIDNGIAVIVGEYGCLGKNKTAEVRNLYNSTVAREFYNANMCPVLWSTPGDQYDRNAAEFTDKEMLEGLFSVFN